MSIRFGPEDQWICYKGKQTQSDQSGIEVPSGQGVCNESIQLLNHTGHVVSSVQDLSGKTKIWK